METFRRILALACVGAAIGAFAAGYPFVGTAALVVVVVCVFYRELLRTKISRFLLAGIILFLSIGVLGINQPSGWLMVVVGVLFALGGFLPSTKSRQRQSRRARRAQRQRR